MSNFFPGNQSFDIIFLYFRTSKVTLELSYLEYLVAYQDFKIVLFNDFFFQLQSVLMSLDRTNHMSTLVKIDKNDIKALNLS